MTVTIQRVNFALIHQMNLCKVVHGHTVTTQLMWHGSIMLAQHCRSVRLTAGGPPDPHGITDITEDGNCLFRSFSYIITGSQGQHMAVRRAILNHMIHIAYFLLYMFRHMPQQCSSIQQYIRHTHMG